MKTIRDKDIKRSISIDDYLTLKEKSTIIVFIFLLGDEYSYLESDTSWLNYFGTPLYIVRMNIEEFHLMDIAIHPKIIITCKGKELYEINGIPKMEVLKSKIYKLSKE